MTVQPYDNPLRFLVTSESRAEVSFIADLGEDECSCEAWEFQGNTAAAAGTPYRCKHIRAAREYLLNLVISKLK